MDFVHTIPKPDPRAQQEQLELQHANFRQRPLLIQHFDALFPNREYLTDPEDENYQRDDAWDEYRSFQKKRRLGIAITAMVCLYRRLPLEALVNLFRHEEAQTVATLAEMLTMAGWIHWDPEREEFVTSQLPKELETMVFNKRYPMPMLCRPKVLEDEQDSPYLTEAKSQSVLGEYSGQVTNLATLNALNSIPLRLNPAVQQHAPDPFKDDDKFRRDSAAVFERIQDQEFHLTWQFDFRGRVYARGYHVNPQGDDWHKHVIQFA
jgi:hypothetical protein